MALSRRYSEQGIIVGREYIKLSGVRSVAPLSLKINSPKAINWTLKQYGYSKCGAKLKIL
jgi:hypothetical protein